MNSKIIILADFEKDLKRLAKKYPSLKSDFADLLNKLKADPKLGTPIGKKLL